MLLKRLLLILLLSPVTGIHAQSTPCNSTGQLTRETYFSAVVGQNMFYTVYTPPCYYAGTATYPVLYLMHGSNDDDMQWVRLGFTQLLDERILLGEVPPIVLVMPFGNVIANRNRFDNFSWNQAFLTELIPDAEAKYTISTEAEYRAIGGISRGGFWAYQIAFSHPHMFSAVGGHSAFFDQYHAEPEHNPLDLALTVPNIGNMRLYLDRGIDDFASDGLDTMSQRLTERGVDFAYVVHPVGEHNNTYWSSHISEYLDFYVSDWLEPRNTVTDTQPSIFVTNTPVSQSLTETPVATASVTSEMLFPVVAFPGLQTSITMSELQAVANGHFDERLVLPQTIAERVNPHPETEIIADEQLRDSLWQSRIQYSLLPLSQITHDYRILLVDGMPIIEQLANYPFAGNISQLTRLTLSGVTALARNTRIALNNNGVAWATEAIQPYVTSSDFFHISNEVSFLESCPQTSADLLGGSSSFCSMPAHFEIFATLDVDIVELTGNHNNDYGYQAYRDTLTFFNTHDITTVGGGETIADARQPILLEHNGNSLALIACNASGPYYALVNEDENALGGIRPGAASCDWNWLEDILPALSEQVNVLIVSVQHIEVEDYQPLPEQQIDFRRIANLGADVVIGSQAHKPQTFEFYPTTRGEIAFIHYGLGNFFFDQPFWGNQRFFLDTLYIADGQLRAIELFTGIIDDFARPRPMTADESENFMFFMLVEQNGF